VKGTKGLLKLGLGRWLLIRADSKACEVRLGDRVSLETMSDGDKEGMLEFEEIAPQ